jgi:hypothetical protein
MTTFFTVSYKNDLDRFILLRETIERFYTGTANHIVVVPKNDYVLFKNAIHDSNVSIETQNDFVDSRYYDKSIYKYIEKYIPKQSWRFHALAGKPGWIIQQIVKLSIPKIVDNGAVVIIDSDFFFTQKFSDSDLGLTNNKRFLFKAFPTSESGMHRKFMKHSRDTLKTPEGPTNFHYLTGLVVWYPEYVKALTNYIETTHSQYWQESLYNQTVISEYSLYGVYLEEIKKPIDLTLKPAPPFFIAWDETSYKDFIENPDKQLANNIIGVIQSNLGHQVSEYRTAVSNRLLNTNLAGQHNTTP